MASTSSYAGTAAGIASSSTSAAAAAGYSTRGSRSRGPTQPASEERPSGGGGRAARPRTTAGWTATSTRTSATHQHHRRTRGRSSRPGAPRSATTTTAGAAAQDHHHADPITADPACGSSSSLVALLLVAKSSSGGSQVVCQWPPKPQLLQRLSQVRYYNNTERGQPSRRRTTRARAGAPDEEYRTSVAFDRQHNAPSEHPKPVLATSSFSRRYRANHDSSSSASVSDSSHDLSSPSGTDDLSWSSADESSSYISHTGDQDDGDPSFTEGESESNAEFTESDSLSGRDFYRSRAGSLAPTGSRLRHELTSNTHINDITNHPQRRTDRAFSSTSNLGGRSLSRTRASLRESAASIRSAERSDRNHLGPNSPRMSFVSDTPSELARKARAYDTYLGYDNSFLAELLTPRPDLCHQKFELTVDDLVFVGHPVCADDREGWVLNSQAEAEVAEPEPVFRGRAPRSSRHSVVSDHPNPVFGASRDQSPSEQSPHSSMFGNVQQSGAPNRSRPRHEVSRAPVGVAASTLSSFHFVLVLDKPDPAQPYLPPGLSSIIPASQLNKLNIDPNLSAQLYYDNIAFKMTAALYNEQCTSGYVSTEAAYLDTRRERSKQKGRKFTEFMARMRARPGSIAKAMADLFESLSKNEGALITINHRIETHLQLPPLLRETRRMLFSADLETERDADEAHLGMTSVWGADHTTGFFDATTSGVPFGGAMDPALDPQALVFEEWKRTTGPHLVPWKTLLMLRNHTQDGGRGAHRETGAAGPVGGVAMGPDKAVGIAKGTDRAGKQHCRGESHGSIVSRFAGIGMSTAPAPGPGSGSGSTTGGRNSHANLSALRGSAVALASEMMTATHSGGSGSGGGGGFGSRPESYMLSSAASVEGGDEDGGRTQQQQQQQMLLGSLGIEGDGGQFNAVDEEDAMMLEARGIEAWVPRFATELEPKLEGIPTLKELAVNLNWDLYQDVYPMVRHLIYYHEARVIDVPFISNIYSISPLVDVTSLPRLSKDWAAAFPMLPDLVRVFSQLSSSGHPFEKQLTLASRLSHPRPSILDLKSQEARQEIYLDALFWLLRADLVVQIQVRYRIVVSEEVKRVARQRREDERREREGRRQARLAARVQAREAKMRARAERKRARVGQSGLSVSPGIDPLAVEPSSISSAISAGQHRIAAELAIPSVLRDNLGRGKFASGPTGPSIAGAEFDLMDDDDEDEDDGILGEGYADDEASSDGGQWEWRDSERGPSLIPEPGRPTNEEAYCLEVVMDGLAHDEPLPGDLEAVFREAVPFFNGKHSVDEIVARRELPMEKLRSLIKKRQSYLIPFYHP